MSKVTFENPNPDGLTQYGRYFWAVHTPDETIMLWADRPTVQDGTLMMVRDAKEDQPEMVVFMLAPGHWVRVNAASILDGHAVAVDIVAKHGKAKKAA